MAQHPNIVGVKLTCGNVGKVVRLASEYNEAQFGVFGGSSDYLIPTLIGGGIGCVTGIGNVYPKCVSHLYQLYMDGKVKEAAELQKEIANAEKACKEGIAATKYGAAYFAGPRAGVKEMEKFLPRRPYLPASEPMENFVVKSMRHLEDLEDRLPDRIVRAVV